MADPRLQQHCDHLNSLEWVRASGRPYIVYTDENDKQHVIRYGERIKKQDDR